MGAKRILLVDDEALVALAAEDVLTEAGYVVVGPVSRVERALPLAESAEIDAAVLDVNLAGVYVWPVAEALTARKIPFVLLTGFGKGLDAPRCCSRTPILAKPLRGPDLLAALEAQMARVRSSSHKAFRDRQPEGAAQS